MKRTIAALIAGMAIGTGAPVGYAVTGRSPVNPVVVTKTGLGTVVDIRSIDLRCFYTPTKEAKTAEAGNGSPPRDPSPAFDCSRLSAGSGSRTVWITLHHMSVSDESGAFYRYRVGRKP
jgi:hypothetical protein